MNQRRTVCYDKTKLPVWIMEQLVMETMDSFLPVCFTEDNHTLTAVFHADGYRPLTKIQSISTEDVFRMLSQLIAQMENNEKYYLFPERYLINRETVYFDLLKGKTKMIFVLNEEGISGKTQLSRLIIECKSIVSEEGKLYLDSLESKLRTEGCDYRHASRYCELLLQEVYVCDVP